MKGQKKVEKSWTRQDFIDRFWSRVDKKYDDECWEWNWKLDAYGYGFICIGRTRISTHRFSYQLHNGEITDGMCVCHSCDNRKCVNPKHLWLGTRQQNNEDRHLKMRTTGPYNPSFGEDSGLSRMKTSEVITLRVLHRLGMKQAFIARWLNIPQSLVYSILFKTVHARETEDRISLCFRACKYVSNEELESIINNGYYPGSLKNEWRLDDESNS